MKPEDEYKQALAELAEADNPFAVWIVIHTARALKCINRGEPIHWDTQNIKKHADGMNETQRETLGLPAPAL